MASLPRFLDILQVLTRHGVEFVVVGGVAAIDMTYEHLAGRTHERVLGELRVRCLNLDTIIESKEQANRDKDRAALPVLRRTLELKGKSGDGG